MEHLLNTLNITLFFFILNECTLKTTCSLKNCYAVTLDQSGKNNVTFRQSIGLLQSFKTTLVRINSSIVESHFITLWMKLLRIIKTVLVSLCLSFSRGSLRGQCMVIMDSFAFNRDPFSVTNSTHGYGSNYEQVDLSPN